MSSTDPNAPQYDCDVCGSEFPDTAGVLACEEHFYCNDCAIEVFHRSMTDFNEFPASCCSRSRNGLPPALFTDLLGKEFMDKYLLKLSEYYTPEASRVYCANPQCAKFHHPRVFEYGDHLHTTASCECGTTTCVCCKTEYQPEHRCLQLDPSEFPAWLPEYTAECRIKQCPQCREWIQLLEACNHMTCTFCLHEFCFVCLLPWAGYNLTWCCPIYGDPPEGYDREGFERTPRAIHLLTGRNRNGDSLNEMPEFLNANMPNPDEDADDVADLFNVAYLAAREAVDAQREDELHGAEEDDEWMQERNEWLAVRDELLEQVRLQDEQIEHLNLQMELGNLALLVEQARLAEHERLHFDAMQAPEPEADVFAGEIDPDEVEHRDPSELARLQRILNISDDEDEGEEEDAEDQVQDTEQDDTLDFGLEMMFENEQDLHDERHPTIQLAGSATSGVLQCSIAVHENPFSMLEEADE